MVRLRLVVAFLYFSSIPTASCGQEDLLSTDKVFERFYLLHRLEPSIDFFIQLIERKAKTSPDFIESICTFDPAVTEQFKHPLVQKNVKHMCMYHDSQTLIRLISTLKHYRHINDDLYVKEVVMLLLVTYNNMISQFCSKHACTSSECSLSYEMQDMTVEELLQTLDEASDSLTGTYEQGTIFGFCIQPVHAIALGLLASISLYLLYQ